MKISGELLKQSIECFPILKKIFTLLLRKKSSPFFSLFSHNNLQCKIYIGVRKADNYMCPLYIEGHVGNILSQSIRLLVCNIGCIEQFAGIADNLDNHFILRE